MRIKKVAGINKYLVLEDGGHEAGTIWGPEYMASMTFAGTTHPEEYDDAYYEANRNTESLSIEKLEFVTQQCKRLGKYCFEYEFDNGRLSKIDGAAVNE